MKRAVLILFFIPLLSLAQGRSPAVEPVLSVPVEDMPVVAPEKAKGFNFKKEETFNYNSLLHNVADKGSSATIFIGITFLMLFPIAVWVALLSMLKARPNEDLDVGILFDQEEPIEPPISLDEYRKSKTNVDDDYKKAG